MGFRALCEFRYTIADSRSLVVLCVYLQVSIKVYVPALNVLDRPEPLSWSGHGPAAASMHGSVLCAGGNGGCAGGAVGPQGEPLLLVFIGVVFVAYPIETKSEVSIPMWMTGTYWTMPWRTWRTTLGFAQCLTTLCLHVG